MSTTEKYHCSSTQARRICLAPKTMILPSDSAGRSSLMVSSPSSGWHGLCLPHSTDRQPRWRPNARSRRVNRPVRFARYDETRRAMAKNAKKGVPLRPTDSSKPVPAAETNLTVEERRLLPDPDVVTEDDADAITAGRRAAENMIPLNTVLKRYGYVRDRVGS